MKRHVSLLTLVLAIVLAAVLARLIASSDYIFANTNPTSGYQYYYCPYHKLPPIPTAYPHPYTSKYPYPYSLKYECPYPYGRWGGFVPPLPLWDDDK